jgi:hypothetical protein
VAAKRSSEAKTVDGGIGKRGDGKNRVLAGVLAWLFHRKGYCSRIRRLMNADDDSRPVGISTSFGDIDAISVESPTTPKLLLELLLKVWPPSVVRLQVGAQEAGMPERQILADRRLVAGHARVQSRGHRAPRFQFVVHIPVAFQKVVWHIHVGNQEVLPLMPRKTRRPAGNPGLDGPKNLDLLGPLHGYGIARRIQAISDRNPRLEQTTAIIARFFDVKGEELS